MNIRTQNHISTPHALAARHAQAAASADTASSASDPTDSVSLSSEARSALAGSGNDVVTVHNAEELKKALENVEDGQTIHLAKGEYRGNFKLDNVSGVTLEGEKGTKLIGESTDKGTTLALDNVENSTIKGLAIEGGQKGLLLDRSGHNTLTDLDVGNTGKEAVHFRSGSSDNLLTRSNIHGAGLDKAGNGEGVYVGSSESNSDIANGNPDRSNNNRIIGNHISGTQSECVDVKEGTTGTVLANNTFDGGAIRGENGATSLVALKGNNAQVSGNTYNKDGNRHVEHDVKIPIIVPGWGKGNNVKDTEDVKHGR